MARGINHVDDDGAVVGVLALVGHRGVLREDGDALFAFEVVGVHHAVFASKVGIERVGLLEHCVYKRGLTVVNVGNDCNVAAV